ncbi:MAG: hypothetical protein DLM72_07565 [Candidatus Nitrosopolaris wilkensis]|nr:MAG: hypothetical protein DLM72_07565 [Candidatus Nitrosopolaris wilkensis]
MIEGLRTRFYAEEDLTPRNLYFVLYVIERARVLIVGSIAKILGELEKEVCLWIMPILGAY